MSAHADSSTAGAAVHTLPASSAPALGLYRDTLQSVFQWATLGELHGIRSVCRSWLAAVESLPAIRVDACVPLSLMFTALASTLAKHIGCFCVLQSKAIGWYKRRTQQLRAPLQVADVAILSSPLLCSSNVHSLHAKMSLLVVTDVDFPSKLTSLDLSLEDFAKNAHMPLLSSISARASLQRLSLAFQELPTYDFMAQLAALAPRLLHLAVTRQRVEDFTTQQIDSMRSCRSLVSLHVQHTNTSVLMDLLSPVHQQPHEPVFPSLQSLHLSALPDDAAAAAVLAFVPSLTELECAFRGGSLAFLSGLKQLRKLVIALRLAQLTSELTASGLMQCRSLTSLTLHGSVIRSVDLTSVLQHCDQISSLKLSRCEQIHTLDFLSVPRLARDLLELELQYCPAVQVSGLVHVESLKALRRLKLVPQEFRSTSDCTPGLVRALKRSLPMLETFVFEASTTLEQMDIDAALAAD